MFKESEKGEKEINIERAEEIKNNSAKIVATGCPFCNTMLTDGTKSFENEDKVEVMDIAELIVKAKDLQMFVDFKSLSKDSRVWIFQSIQMIDNTTIEKIKSKLKLFLDNWK